MSFPGSKSSKSTFCPPGTSRYTENLGDFVYAAAGPAVQAEQQNRTSSKKGHDLWFFGAIDMILYMYIIYIFESYHLPREIIL
jgi:hypothetical protein